MLSTTNLKSLHGMCWPRIINLQSGTNLLFSGLAIKKISCLAPPGAPQSYPEPGLLTSVLPHQYLAEATSQFTFMLWRLPALTELPNAPFVREKQSGFFSQLLHIGSNILHTYIEQLWPSKIRSWVFRKVFSDLWYCAQQKSCHSTAAAVAEMPCAALTYCMGRRSRTRRMLRVPSKWLYSNMSFWRRWCNCTRRRKRAAD